MRYLFLLIIVVAVMPLRGQTSGDSAIVLPEAIVEGDRYSLLPVGTRQDSLDITTLSAQTTGSLDDVLEADGLVFVRKYGAVGLSSISFRGTSASQSALLWNGMNLQSPMNGQKDLRLFPAFFLENASVTYGTGSAIAGSGAVGATVEMNTAPSQLSGWSTGWHAAFGSFGLSTYGASVGFGKKGYQMKTKGFYRSAENDYSYINTTQFNNPSEELKHASVKKYGVQQHHSYTSKAGKFELNWMHLSSERLLPPTIFEARSGKAQQDETTYANAGWNYQQGKHAFNLDVGWIREAIDYQDTLSGLFSTNLANSIVIQPEYSRSIGNKHLLKISGYHRTDLAELDAVEKQVDRSESALIASLALVAGSDWLINANLRQGYSIGRFQPLIPSVSTSYAFTDQLAGKFQLARHYREPTLNDLYWEPGGNPDLAPEDGSSLDATLRWKHQPGPWQIHVEATGYYTYIQNQIVWQPEENVWTPHNLSEVFSRGVESKLKVSYVTNDWQFSLQTGGTFTRASEDDFTNPNQVAQVPMLKSIHRAAVHWCQYAIEYGHMITSSRYTNASNTASLPGYDVGRLEVTGKMNWEGLALKGFFRVENIWDRNYRIIAAQFMPPRHFKTGIQISFQ